MSFSGFPNETIQFLTELKQNNSKHWFEENRDRYEKFLLIPAKEFTVSMGIALRAISQEINAIPKVDKSIFRLHRDIRFSQDKSPYKTHLGIFFWEGSEKKMDCPGFYFHLEPPNLMLGAGLYMFNPEFIKTFRDAVVDINLGKELTHAINKVTDKFPYRIGGKHYKRIPAGYSADHPNAEYLLYKGLHIGEEINIPDALYQPSIIDFCLERYKQMAPIHKWLVDVQKTIKE